MVCEVSQNPGPSLHRRPGHAGGDFQTTVLDEKQLLQNAAPRAHDALGVAAGGSGARRLGGALDKRENESVTRAEAMRGGSCSCRDRGNP